MQLITSQSQIDFTQQGVEGSFDVLRFSSNQYGLGEAFEFEIEALSTVDLTQHAYIVNNLPSTLRWMIDEENNWFEIIGFIDSYERTENTVNQAGQYHYTLKFFSPWLQGLYRTTCQAWTNETVLDIIREKLEHHELGGYNIVFNCYRQHEPLPSVIQYNETDKDFLTRLLQRHGLFFYSIVYKGNPQLIISDDSRLLGDYGAPTELDFYDGDGFTYQKPLVFGLQSRATNLSVDVYLNDYNPDDVDADLHVHAHTQAGINGFGERHYHTIPYYNRENGEQLAKQIMASIDVERYQVSIQTTCRNLVPGQLLTINGHPIHSFNTTYRVIRIQHQMNQAPELSRNNKTALRYENNVTLIPAKQLFHLPIDAVLAAQQKYHGLFTPAKIASTDGGDKIYPELDAQGRYRIKYAFVRPQDNKNRHYHSPSLRLLQRYGGRAPNGKAYGMHYPLRVGTDVIVGFIDGEFAKPVILGALASPKQPSPVTNKNAQEYKWRTWGGNEFMIHDEPDKNIIRFNTQNVLQSLTLSAIGETHAVVFQNKTGSMRHFAQEDFVQTSGTQKIFVGGNHIVTSAKSMLDTKGNIYLETESTLKLIAEGAIRWQSGQNITMQTGGSYRLNSKGPIQLLSKQGNLNISASQINIKAKGVDIVAPTIELGSAGKISGSSVSISNLVLKAPVIDVYPPKGGSSSGTKLSSPPLLKLKRHRSNPIKLQKLIALNLREDVSNDYFKSEKQANDPYKRDTLHTDEVNYFIHNGNNATIFIHGFGVEYGKFGKEIQVETDLEKQQLKNSIYAHDDIYRSATLVKKLYPTATVGGAVNFDDEDLNGTGAHSWWLHMEYNLNQATGQLHEVSYSNYARMIHVAWQGDPASELDYMAAVEQAKKAAVKLVKVIEQLQPKGIQINIIAHSLGNEVLLKAMDLLGEQGKADCIDHVFMWDPSVPNDALSSPATNDNLCGLYQFPHATKTAKKITVLYSQDDNILGPVQNKSFTDVIYEKINDPAAGVSIAVVDAAVLLLDKLPLPRPLESIYHVVNMIGQPVHDFTKSQANCKKWYQTWRTKYKTFDSNIEHLGGRLLGVSLNEQCSIMRNYYSITYEGLKTVIENFVDQSPVKKRKLMSYLNIFESIDNEEKRGISALAKAIKYKILGAKNIKNTTNDYVTAIIMTVFLTEGVNIKPALGYSGADLSADNTRKLITSAKLIPVDQHNWLTSHSAMKIPSPALMKHVYKKYIFGSEGMKRLGRIKYISNRRNKS